MNVFWATLKILDALYTSNIINFIEIDIQILKLALSSRGDRHSIMGKVPMGIGSRG